MAVVAGYFAYLMAAALAARVPRPRKAVALLVSATVLSSLAVVGMPTIVPFIYLVIGYWVPAVLVSRISVPLERRLMAFDRQLFGERGVLRFEERMPRLLVEYLEGAYLLCYAVPPAGWALLVFGGHSEELSRFWWTVLPAGYACYGPLPWAVTRTPRSLEPAPATSRSSVRALNVAVLGRVSVQWNTFPSGHTAVSLATALALLPVMPVAAAILLVASISIAAGSVIGRYHYAADAVAGVLVAIGAHIMAIAVHAL